MDILENESLSKHTTFHLGGVAKYFCDVKSIKDLGDALCFAKEKNIPHFVLGGGSNVAMSDKGYSGLVVRISSSKIMASDKYIECDAGVSLATVVKKSFDEKLIGLEWAQEIPGTIGGAVRGNAGAYRGEMKDAVASVKVFRNGKLIELKNKDCKFDYRESVFKNTYDIIWSVKLKLKKGSPDELKSAIRSAKKIRKERADKFGNQFSAGSFFKNILMSEKETKDFKNNFSEFPEKFVRHNKVPASWLIDQCDLRGFCIGDICVSEKHAGVLINRGKGTSDELNQLVGIIKMKVRNRFNIDLEEEVQYLK